MKNKLTEPLTERFGIPASQMQSYASDLFNPGNDNHNMSVKPAILSRKARSLGLLKVVARLIFGWAKPKPQPRPPSFRIGYRAGFGARCCRIDYTPDKVDAFTP